MTDDETIIAVDVLRELPASYRKPFEKPLYRYDSVNNRLIPMTDWELIEHADKNLSAFIFDGKHMDIACVKSVTIEYHKNFEVPITTAIWTADSGWKEQEPTD